MMVFKLLFQGLMAGLHDPTFFSSTSTSTSLFHGDLFISSSSLIIISSSSSSSSSIISFFFFFLRRFDYCSTRLLVR